MIDVLDTIKQAYDRSTTQVDKIILNGKEYRISNVEYYDDTYLDGNIFGTAIGKNIDFEIENTIDLEGQEIECLTGITTNGTIHWISLGKFIIQDVQSNNTTNIAKVTATDYMLKTNIPYVSDLDYESGRVTLLNVLQEVCTKSGLTLATTSFTNSTFIVDSNQFTEETLNRQVIQAVAQVSGTVAKIRNNQLYLINPNQIKTVSKVFTLNNYKEAEIKRATHPINLVSLGMADIEGENITLRDETSIAKNGENSLVINDNPFAYTQAKREQLITALFNAVKGFEYKSYSFKNCQGLPYLETLDKIQYKDKEGNTYDSFIFRFNNKSPNGLESTIEAPSITKATVAYQNVPSALDIAKRTEIKVDKQNQTIQAVVEETNELQTQVTDITTTQATLEGTEIKIDDAAEEPIIKLEVNGASNQATKSGKNLFDNKIALSNTTYNADDDIWTFDVVNKYDHLIEKGNLNIEPNTDYVIMLDIVDNTLSDTLNFHYSSSTAWEVESSFHIPVGAKGIFKYQLHSKSDLSSYLYDIWFSHLNTITGNFKTKIMLCKGTLGNEGEYEQYGASPSPEFPSEIHSIGDDVNLFDISTSQLNKALTWASGNYFNNTGSVSSDFIEVEEGKTYVSKYYIQVILFDENKNYLKQYNRTNVGVKSFTINSDNPAKYVKISFYSLSNSNINFTQIKDLKLQKGTVATAYSEYGKGTVEIKQSGKNLFSDELELGSLNGSGYNVNSDADLRNKDYISIQPNTQYTISIPYETRIATRYYDINKTFISSRSTKQSPVNFTTPNNAYYVRFSFLDQIDTSLNVMLEKGTEATEYEEYKGNNYVIPTTPLRSLPNGVKDTIEEDGIHRRVGSVVLNGSEDEIIGYYSGSTAFYIDGLKELIKKPENNNIINVMSNYFKGETASHCLSSDYNYCIGFNTNGTLWLRYNNFTTSSELKTWLSKNPVTVQYELPEEVIEPFDEEQQAVINSITTMLGTQYFTCDANMRITYVRDNGLSDMYETKQNASKRSAQLQIQIDEINSKVESVEDLTVGKSGTKSVILENCAKGSLLKLQIKGNNDVFKHLYPSDTLYPSNTLYPYGDSRIKVTNNDGQKIYELGVTEVLRANGNIYDEYILENGIAKVIRRINTNGTVKTTPTEEVIGEYSIDVAEGTNTIEIVNYSATMNVLYAIKSNFTEIFATKVEVSSEISQKADEINLEVSKKVGNDEIISRINQSAEEIQINADKINIDGKAARFKTEINETLGPYTNDDTDRIKQIMKGEIIATNDDYDKYDIDKDGEINSSDLLKIQRAIVYSNGYIYINGIFSIDPYSSSKAISVYDNNKNYYSAMIGVLSSMLHSLTIKHQIEFHGEDDSETYINNGSISHNEENYNYFWHLGNMGFGETEKGHSLSLNTPNGYIDISASDGYDTSQTGILVGTQGSQTVINSTEITTPTLTQTSREESKKNFEKLENGLDIVKNTDIYKYNLKAEKDETKKHIGFIIGENYNYSQEITSKNNDGVDTYSMISVAYKAIQELAAENRELKARIEALEKGENNG